MDNLVLTLGLSAAASLGFIAGVVFAAAKAMQA